MKKILGYRLANSQGSFLKFAGKLLRKEKNSNQGIK